MQVPPLPHFCVAVIFSEKCDRECWFPEGTGLQPCITTDFLGPIFDVFCKTPFGFFFGLGCGILLGCGGVVFYWFCLKQFLLVLCLGDPGVFSMVVFVVVVEKFRPLLFSTGVRCFGVYVRAPSPLLGLGGAPGVLALRLIGRLCSCGRQTVLSSFV